MRVDIGKNKTEFLDAVSDGGAGGEGLTVDNIFETLSRGDKDEKDNEGSDPGDENDSEVDNSDVIPLKKKEGKDEKSDGEDDEDQDEDDEEESEEDDEEDDEEELESDDEDELELTKIPTKAQIEAKYPNIFKEFKALKHIFYREKAFADVFPTVKDAKVAKEELGEYGKIQDELLSGDIVPVLARVKQSNPKAYEKISQNIIDSLIKVDKDSYIEAARVVTKSALNNLYTLATNALKKDATNKRAEQMQIAAELIHEGLFGTAEVSPYSKQEKEEDKVNPELEKLKKERQELDNSRFQEAHSKVSNKFVNKVTKTLEKNIDPKGVLAPYMRTNLIKDIKVELDKQMIADKRFGGIITKLYERAKAAGYSEESLNQINTALENKASSILLDIIKAKKGEALKGTSTVRKMKSRELSRENEGESATTRNSRSSSDRSLTRNTRPDKSKDEPQPGESAYDYLTRKLG